MTHDSIQVWWRDMHVGNVFPKSTYEFEHCGRFELVTSNGLLISFLRADTQECDDELSRFGAFDAEYLESTVGGWSLKYPDGTREPIMQPAIYVDDEEVYWESA